MGFFSNISDRIFGHKAVPTSPPIPAPEAPAAAKTADGTVVPAAVPATVPASVEIKTPVVVDVAAVLDGLAAKHPEKLEWRRSIVDLMKLVGLDSGLAVRKGLAEELNYPGSTKDSAAMNTWLHKEVIRKLAANGGKVPDDLLD